MELGHLYIVGNNRTVLHSGHDKGNVHPRVIVLTVVIHDTTDETVLLQHWESLKGLTLTHPVGTFHILFTSKEIVELASGIVIRKLPPGVDRKKNSFFWLAQE